MKQVPSANRWFNNIAGIIEGFVQYGLAEPGSWLSIVDAAILQGVQDGYARSAGLVAAPSVNPGAHFWRQFFDALGSPTHDLERINLWGCAETAATNFGVEMATVRGLSPNKYEWVFWQTGNIYRWLLLLLMSICLHQRCPSLILAFCGVDAVPYIGSARRSYGQPRNPALGIKGIENIFSQPLERYVLSINVLFALFSHWLIKIRPSRDERQLAHEKTTSIPCVSPALLAGK